MLESCKISKYSMCPPNLAHQINPSTPQPSRSAVYHSWQALVTPSKGLSFPNLLSLPRLPSSHTHLTHRLLRVHVHGLKCFSYHLSFISPLLTHLILRVHVRTRLKEDPCHRLPIQRRRIMQVRTSILESAPKSVPGPWGKPPPRPMHFFVPDLKLDTSTQ